MAAVTITVAQAQALKNKLVNSELTLYALDSVDPTRVRTFYYQAGMGNVFTFVGTAPTLTQFLNVFPDALEVTTVVN